MDENWMIGYECYDVDTLFHQYIATWIYAMPNWNLKFAFVRNE